MEIALVYLRVSSEDQAQSGLGIASQRERCKAMAIVKGWSVPDGTYSSADEENKRLDPATCGIFIDDGISGTLPPAKRPALAALLERVKGKGISGVIFSDLSRLARGARLTLDLVDALAKKTEIISCGESMDTTTASGKLQLTIMAAIHQHARDVTAERTRYALAELAKEGKQRGGVPYGYKRGNSFPVERKGETLTRYHLEPDPAEQEVIELIRGLSESYSLRSIAWHLNDRGIPTRKGTRWTKTQIQRILNYKPATT